MRETLAMGLEQRLKCRNITVLREQYQQYVVLIHHL